MRINCPLTTLLILLSFSVCRLSGQDLSDLKNVKPFDIRGSIGLNTSFYNVSGIPERQSPFSYGVNANATLTLYGISMPFSLTWYNNKKGRFSQPFNQFGISPKYKWLTVHFGYRNISFSEFTLNGYTFLGAGGSAPKLLATLKTDETTYFDPMKPDREICLYAVTCLGTNGVESEIVRWMGEN